MGKVLEFVGFKPSRRKCKRAKFFLMAASSPVEHRVTRIPVAHEDNPHFIGIVFHSGEGKFFQRPIARKPQKFLGLST